MQSTLDTACVVPYNSKDCRRILGGGQGSSWNTRPKPSLIANVSAAFERVCMCVCTHIYDCVCPCVVWGKGVEARVVFKIHLCRRHNTCVEAKGGRRLKYSRVVRALSECVLPLASRFPADGCVNNVLLPAGRFRIGSAVCSACAAAETILLKSAPREVFTARYFQCIDIPLFFCSVYN